MCTLNYFQIPSLYMKRLKHVISISSYQISRNLFHGDHHILQPSCFYIFYQNVIPFSLEQRKQVPTVVNPQSYRVSRPRKILPKCNSFCYRLVNHVNRWLNHVLMQEALKNVKTYSILHSLMKEYAAPSTK